MRSNFADIVYICLNFLEHLKVSGDCFFNRFVHIYRLLNKLPVVFMIDTIRAIWLRISLARETFDSSVSKDHYASSALTKKNAL